MRKLMRTAITATTVLGLVLLAIALSGISALADQLETATPQRALPPAPATEQVSAESRKGDCPVPERTQERRKI